MSFRKSFIIKLMRYFKGGRTMDNDNNYNNYNDQQTGGSNPDNQPYGRNDFNNQPYGSNDTGSNYQQYGGNDTNSNYQQYGGNYGGNDYNYQPYGESNQNSNYSQYQYNNNNSYQMPYTPPPQMDMEEPVSVGEWIIAYLLMLIPCVNIVLMFVFAFSKTEKKSKSNYFKAMLIVTGIVLVLYFIVVIALVAMGVSAGSMYRYY